MLNVLFICYSLINGQAPNQVPQVDAIAAIQKNGLCYKANQAKKALALQPPPQPAQQPPSQAVPVLPPPASRGFSHDCLNAHNSARKNYGMPELSWSEDLALYSENYSGNISFNRIQHSGRSGVGENIFAASGGSTNGICSAAVESWMGEAKDYGKNNGAVVGHFTQVIWKTTQKVGCGTINGVVTCQYSPPGNWVGRTPYDG